jgi:TatD DNase family protein
MKFIDIHCHLDLCKDLSKIIENAKKKNIKVILTCGINKKTLEISKKFPEVKACLGIYPTDCLKLNDQELNGEIQFIKQNKKKIIAIGEVGLDLHHGNKLEKQKQNLKKFIELAKELDIPIIVHSRKAEKDTIDLLENLNCKKVIMHCFSGNMKLVKRIINNSWYLSIPTCVKYNEHFQKIIELTQIDSLFCETDSPFLHPEKKEDNQPVNVIESYKKIAEIKRLSLEKVRDKIYENYKKIF